MKLKGKTSDGYKLSNIKRTLESIPNVSIKPGRNHTLLAKYNAKPAYGLPGLCALGRTTSYTRHIVPWVKKVTGLEKSSIDDLFSGREVATT